MSLKRMILLVALAASAVSGGCAAVKPYQREFLSERVMTPGSDAIEDRFRQHWQFAREGSEGGFGGAGGGCGCN
jgi:hypothetical protein